MKAPRRNKVALAVRKAKVAARLANGRTPAEQLATLDARLGVGVGAKKERARLAKLIAGTAKVTKVVKAETEVTAAEFKALKASAITKPLKAAKVKKATK